MTKQRETGPDRLRALAAFFVVGIHLFPLIVDLNAGRPDVSYFAELFCYALVFCAVNCFGLLSGYLGYREENNLPRVSALIVLWLQFLFYRVVFLLLPMLAGLAEPISLADIFLPLTRRANWYMSCYFELMLFAPLLNLVIRRIPRGLNALMCAVLFVLSTAAALLRGLTHCDPFLLSDGYSWMWLGFLYFWGASVKKHGWGRTLSARTLWKLILGALLLMAGWRFLMQVFFLSPAFPWIPDKLFPGRFPWLPRPPLPAESFPGRTEKIFYSYPSPTAVIPALCLLLLHLRIKPGRRDAPVSKLSSAALGVFLLHTTVYGWLLVPHMELLRPFHAPWGVVNALLSSFAVALLCVPVDLLRARLFRLLGVKKIADRIQAWVFARGERFCARFETEP